VVFSLFQTVESYCVPHFDSPSIFARILDKDKGGHFSVTPTIPFSTKQNYLPSSNVTIFFLNVPASCYGRVPLSEHNGTYVPAGQLF
jgi:GH15 family glucan-1,4-alpha-glucosidase